MILPEFTRREEIYFSELTIFYKYFKSLTKWRKLKNIVYLLSTMKTNELFLVATFYEYFSLFCHLETLSWLRLTPMMALKGILLTLEPLNVITVVNCLMARLLGVRVVIKFQICREQEDFSLKYLFFIIHYNYKRNIYQLGYTFYLFLQNKVKIVPLHDNIMCIIILLL